MKKWLPLIIIAVIVIGIFRWGVGLNNTMVEKQETAKTQWANVESAYQRRSDLIPNLVSTVKGYADFERETLEAVIQARANATKTTIDPTNITPEQMATVTERLRDKGVDGFTYVTDMRFDDRINRQTRPGDPETAGLNGLRFQYVPEFDDTFDPQKATESYNKAADLFRSVVNDTVSDGNVSDARITYYDTEVYFRDDYDEQLSRTIKEGSSGAGGDLSRGANDPQSNSGEEVGTKLSTDVPDGVVQEARTEEVTGRRI